MTPQAGKITYYREKTGSFAVCSSSFCIDLAIEELDCDVLQIQVKIDILVLRLVFMMIDN